MNNKTSNIYPWVVVGLLWGVALLNYMDRQMLFHYANSNDGGCAGNWNQQPISVA